MFERYTRLVGHRLTNRAKATCLLWVYAFLLLSQAVHALAPHGDSHALASVAKATLTSGCEGPCHDPHHDHAPAAHEDHCPACKMAGQAARLAPAGTTFVTLDTVLSNAPGPIDSAPQRVALLSAPARGPPRVG